MGGANVDGGSLSKIAEMAGRADFRVGAMLVSPSRRLVGGPGGEVHVEPLIMNVFLLLVGARGQVVTRDALFDAVWGGAMVGDDSLNRAIAKVRRIGATVAPGEFEIETIPRTGYRLTGAVADGGEPDDDALARPVARRRMLLATAFGGAALAVSGGAVLLRRNDDSHFYDLLRRGRSAMDYGTAGSDAQSLAVLREAVGIRPRDAAAWGLLAVAQRNLAEAAPPDRSAAMLTAAEAAARRALTLNDREPNALTAMAMLQGSMLDWAQSEDLFRRAYAIDLRNTLPLDELVWLLQAVGRNHDSWALNERAVALKPLSPTHQFRRALKLWIAGRMIESDMVTERARQLWPTHPLVWNARFIIFSFSGRPRAAQAMLDDNATRPAQLASIALATWRAALLALDHPSPQNVAAAREAILGGAKSSPGIAAHGVMFLAALGEVDAAFAVANGFLLSRGAILVSPNLEKKRVMVNDPNWRATQWLFTPPSAALRADPRFAALCDGIGLTAYWNKRGIVPDYRRA